MKIVYVEEIDEYLSVIVLEHNNIYFGGIGSITYLQNKYPMQISPFYTGSYRVPDKRHFSETEIKIDWYESKVVVKDEFIKERSWDKRKFKNNKLIEGPK